MSMHMSKSAAIALGITAAAALVLGSSSASAQEKTARDWRFTITPYGWLTELSGRVGVGPVTSSVYVSPSDILKALKFAAMAYTEARYGPYVISADGIYASLGANRVLAIRGDTGRLDLTQSETIIQPMAGYSFRNAYGWDFDLLAGARYWKLNAALDVDLARRPSTEHSAARDWLDGLVGVRARWRPLDRVRLSFNADAGAGGSKATWQLYSTLGYDIVSSLTLGASYRALAVDYDRSDFLFDTNTHGFAFGLTYRFP